jgi:host factor-I protein
MESKTAQNVQDTYFNALRKDKASLIIYLVNGVRVFGRIRSFDKYSVLIENGNQDQLVFKHAISTVVLAANADRRVAASEGGPMLAPKPADTAHPISSPKLATGIAPVPPAAPVAGSVQTK